MPVNIQALALLLVFIVPGFVFVEVDARRRPAQKLGTFDKTVLSILFSTVLHAVLSLIILLLLLSMKFDITRLVNRDWLAWGGKHPICAYGCTLSYFLLCIVIAGLLGYLVGAVTHRWTPVLSRVVRRDKQNSVLVQMKNGDFFTGALGMIPADYDVLQSQAKDFTIVPPGRYKPKGRPWQKLLDGETVLLNTSNVDAIRIL